MKIFGDKKSGNCYKVQLLCENLNLAYTWVDIDILHQETQTATFLAMNPNGKIPVVQLDNGEVLTESNAILFYLAQQSPLLPSAPLLQAKILQWQFFEQYSHEPYIAVARFINKYLGLPEDRLLEYKQKQAGGYQALDMLEQQLLHHDYLVNDQYSIADISLYAYTHVCDEGGFSLTQYPNIKAWLKRIEQQSGYCAM